MKNKTKIFFLAIIASVILGSIGKNIYFKRILEKELSKSLKQNVTIKKANLNILSNSFKLENTIFEKDKIQITHLYTEMSFKEFLKDKKNFTIESIDIKDIIFINQSEVSSSTNSKDETITTKFPEHNISAKSEIKNEKTSQFLNEIDKQIKNDGGLSNIFNSALNKENFSKNMSNNLTNFLIKNADFIDIILQTEINSHLKNRINSFSKNSKEFIYKIKIKNNENNILIKNISFSGSNNNIKFLGNFKNFNTDFSKNTLLPINITLSEINGNGEGKIYGDLNSNTLSGNIYMKLNNFKATSFNNINTYLSDGNINSEQIININGEIIKIDGTTEISHIQINKSTIQNSNSLDNFKKNILNEFIRLTETKEYNLKVYNNFSTNTNFINIKTTLPEEIRRTLINNRVTFNDFLENQLKNQYKNSFEEKKNKVKNFFKNIF
ncbi:MAG: hypothetical protein ACRC7F_03425 [Cetobacterium sp.]|uniref:hypothetical protein n=1 Tax=unclassified Cetobacterium TaxID=2630983 RepID=UPI000646B44E|nr:MULTISPECIES: hypothetical protein [unclassified Cetobacterium]